MILSNKRVLIISSEPWEHDFLSKHHLAIALSKRGNQVFFLNPPATYDSVYQADGYSGITIINYRPFIRGLNTFPSAIAGWLSGIDIRRIHQLAKGGFDVVWTFDPFRFQHIRKLGAPITIYHAADIHDTKGHEARLVASSDIVLAPSHEVLQKLKHPHGLCTGHMISMDLLKQMRTAAPIALPGKSDVKIVYAGNLLSRFMAYDLLLKTIERNASCDFIFVGDNSLLKDHAQWKPVMQLSNVYFTGRKNHHDMSAILANATVLWYCYDTQKYWKEASNSHKILEYLATGHVVVGTPMAYYQQFPGIIDSPEQQDQLPETMQKVVSNIELYNAPERVAGRFDFVQRHTFEHALVRIEHFLTTALK